MSNTFVIWSAYFTMSHLIVYIFKYSAVTIVTKMQYLGKSLVSGYISLIKYLG